MAKLFDKNIVPACKYCAHGRDCVGIEKTLCEKKGAVDPDGRCVAFRYDPLRRQPKKSNQVEEYSETDFLL